MTRLFVFTLTLMVAFTIFAPSASAGGWATVVFDPLPEEINAGETVTVRFIVRQHGNVPVHSAFGAPLVTTLSLRLTPGGKASSIEATPDEEVGYYVADVTFPQQGAYELMVTTNALDTTEVAPQIVTVDVSSAAEPVRETPAQNEDTTTETLVAGATTPAASSPMVIVAGIGIFLLLVMGTIVVVRTRYERIED